MDEEEKISKISKYYGDRFKELEVDVKYINEQFLMWIVTHLCDIEYPFGSLELEIKAVGNIQIT